MIYWLTGPAKSGKTTYARKLRDELRKHGIPVFVLDGDDVRRMFPVGFSDEDRRHHIIRMAKIASIAESQGISVIISCVSPKREIREEARKYFKDSMLIYMPDGELWEGTSYDVPKRDEFT